LLSPRAYTGGKGAVPPLELIASTFLILKLKGEEQKKIVCCFSLLVLFEREIK